MIPVVVQDLSNDLAELNMRAFVYRMQNEMRNSRTFQTCFPDEYLFNFEFFYRQAARITAPSIHDPGPRRVMCRTNGLE